jgi:hypothetical protein
MSSLSKHTDIIQSVVGDEGGEAQKITRAVGRTEATLPEHRWYFFDTQSKLPKPERAPFPDMFIPDSWRADLEDPQLRYHTFVSGFAEDMVLFENNLPDEIFMWMVDEICLDSDEVCDDIEDITRFHFRYT